MQNLPPNKKIILFDGVCNLCNTAVQFIIEHDKKDVFRFVALQSDLGHEIIKHIGIDTKVIDSIVLYQPGVAYYYKSAAALEIAKDLNVFFYWTRILNILPERLRNSLYDYIARNRYKWYGKKETCIMPTNALKLKFL